MSTSTRSRSIIPLIVHPGPDGSTVAPPGAYQIVAAFNARDAMALAVAVRTHPGAWEIEMPWRESTQTGPRLRHDCPPVKMAAALGWTPGLAVLLDAGLDPNGRSRPADATALTLAVRLGRDRCIKPLLAAAANFSGTDPARTIGALFDTRYSRAWMDRCWKIVDALAGHDRLPWPSPSLLLALLDCRNHPDGGAGQATRLVQQYPVPAGASAVLAAALAGRMHQPHALWRQSQRPEREALFAAMASQHILPTPWAFIQAATRRWGQDASPNIRQRIQDIVLERLADCTPGHARAILADFGTHPCLAGQPLAELSRLSMDSATQATASSGRAAPPPRL